MNEDAGKCQYGAYGTTFMSHAQLTDSLMLLVNFSLEHSVSTKFNFPVVTI